jgi:signal transduction histidine kinase/ligand-binding sensor domain-containing protein
MLRFAALWALVFTLTVTVSAQQKFGKFHPSKPLNQNAIDQWTTDQGLSTNNLVNVMQARSGYLWISTYDGLLRFDGTTFEVFDRTNIPILKTDAFYKGYEDEHSNIWFATQGSGIIKYRDNNFTVVKTTSNLPNSIHCLLLRKSGLVLVGTNNNGLFTLKDSVATQAEHPSLREGMIVDLTEDKFGNVWVATNGNGLIAIEGDKITQYSTEQGLTSNVVNTVRGMRDGRLLIGTVNGLNILANQKISPLKLTEGLQVTDIEIDEYQSIWLTTERGLVRLNEALDVEEILSPENGLPGLSLTSLAFDREGSLWVTGSRAGLIRLKDASITTYYSVHGLSSNIVNVVYESPFGKIYIGTDAGEVDVFENGTFTQIPIRQPHKNIGVRSLWMDKQSNLLIGSYNGLLLKRGYEEKIFNAKSGLPSQEVRRALVDEAGYTWIATRSGGVIKMKADKVVRVFDLTGGLQSNYILALEKDAYRNVYVGTNGGGLSIINEQDSVTTLRIKEDDSGILTFNIHIDDDGSVWLVTTAGILLFDGKQFRQLPLVPSQKGEGYFDWVVDDFANIWITSNKGVLRIKPEQIRDFKNGKDTPIKPQVFNQADGMRNRESTSTMRALKTSKGEIWVPTIGGVSVINPKKITENTILPPVYVTRMVTDDSTYYPADNIQVAPGNLRYTFHFTSLSLVASARNQFRYWLVGVDETWQDNQNLREVTYTNLAPGNYTFRVIATNNDAVWNETGDTISFRVRPTLFQTNSFYAVTGFVLFLMIFSIYKWRVNDVQIRNRELQKVNSELDKFVYSASHDLRAPLASVLGVVNVARLDKDEDQRENYLNLIERSIKKLDGFISDIINFSRNARLEVVYTEVDFEKLVNEIMDDLKYMDEDSRITRRISTIGSGRFYTDSIRLKIVLSNLISNSIKYHNLSGKNPFIEVKIKYDTHTAIIKVIDNGLGIPEQHLPNIFKMFYRANENSKGSGIGLYIVQETIQKIEGTITVKSKLGAGTEFEISIPSAKE